MLPSGSGIQIVSDINKSEQTNKTYYLDKENKRIIGTISDIGSIEQAVYLILSIERYEYAMFSWNYGIELNDLYGNIKEIVVPRLITRVKEALIQDDRISEVNNFSYSINKNKYLLSFNVVSVYGNINFKDVIFNV